ncbi:MAG TPA: hypothetical protein VMV66_00995 [Candidatus Humimicrobiaceae bacterium]|nr:hypothetical protein [Candidatus Humimicrobiaceae bacterium]
MWLTLLILFIVGGIVTIKLVRRSRREYDRWYHRKVVKEGNPKLASVAFLTGIISFGLFVAFLVVARPLGHWLWFGIYRTLPFLILTVAIIIAGVVAYILTRKTAVWKIVAISWAVLLVVLSIFGVSIVKTKLCAETEERMTIIETLPLTTEIRYLPMEIAQYYAEVRIPDPEISLGELQPILKDGELVWIAARRPDGFIRSLKYKTDGVAIIYSDGSVGMNYTSRQLGLGQQNREEVPGTFTYGEGMRVEDDIYWQLRKSKYWVEYCEVFYLFDDDTPLAVVPYIGYRMSFPVMVPYWAGVATVHPDGTITHYTPEEAQQLDFVQGQRIYPERLARRYTVSWAYHQGISNAWFTHRDQIDIPELAYSKNQMPYLLPTDEGTKWVTVAEPHGEATHGIFKVFFIDAVTGEIELYEIPPATQDILVGPNRAWEYVKAAYPLYNWMEEGRTGEGPTGAIKLLEPRPIITKDTIYWMMSVTTREHAFAPERPSTMLVDARTTKVYEFSSEEEIERFLAGEPVVPEPEPVPSEETPDLLKLLELLKELEKWLPGAIEEVEGLLK